MAKALSSLRAQMLDLTKHIQQLQETFLLREPLLPGSVYTLKRRCGKPNCRCARGHLHQTEVLSYRGGPRPRNVTPRPEQLKLFKQGTEAYRRFRQARAQLVKLQRQMLKLVDRIEAQRVLQGKKKFDVSPKQAP
jgi:hypothetical protein